MTRWLLWGGVIGPVLFVLAFMLIGLMRPDYDAQRHFISLLALTDAGWQQTANFLVSGALVAAGGLGMWRAFGPGRGARAIPMLVMLAGLGSIVSGLFPSDPALGYPPGTPPGLPTDVTVNGAVHDLAAIAVLIGLPAANIILARRLRGAGGVWVIYSWLTAIGTIGLLVAAFVFTDVAGLLQRLAAVLAFAWIARLSLGLLSQTEPEPDGEPAE